MLGGASRADGAGGAGGAEASGFGGVGGVNGESREGGEGGEDERAITCKKACIFHAWLSPGKEDSNAPLAEMMSTCRHRRTVGRTKPRHSVLCVRGGACMLAAAAAAVTAMELVPKVAAAVVGAVGVVVVVVGRVLQSVVVTILREILLDSWHAEGRRVLHPALGSIRDNEHLAYFARLRKSRRKRRGDRRVVDRALQCVGHYGSTWTSSVCTTRSSVASCSRTCVGIEPYCLCTISRWLVHSSVSSQSKIVTVWEDLGRFS